MISSSFRRANERLSGLGPFSKMSMHSGSERMVTGARDRFSTEEDGESDGGVGGSQPRALNTSSRPSSENLGMEPDPSFGSSTSDGVVVVVVVTSGSLGPNVSYTGGVLSFFASVAEMNRNR